MDILAAQTGLFVKQTRKGCFQELMGCEATTEFDIANMEDREKNIMYALEESSFCIRLCCKNIRPFKMQLSPAKGEAPFLEYERPYRCSTAPMKCCCFQSMTVRKPGSDEIIGTFRENFFCNIPQFSADNAKGEKEFYIHAPTCCCGQYVDICREMNLAKGVCCRVPFYIYNLDNKEGEEIGEIIKVWGGLATEMFTDADKFEVKFPKEASVEQKAVILGGVFLINQLYFEGDAGDN